MVQILPTLPLIRTAKGDVFVLLFSLAAYQSLYPLLLLLPLSIQIAQHEGQLHF
jgi:hypothetical protein